MTEREAFIELLRDHIEVVMECKSQKELQSEIFFILRTLDLFNYPVDKEEKEQFTNGVMYYNRPDYQQAKIELAKLLTIELSLIKMENK